MNDVVGTLELPAEATQSVSTRRVGVGTWARWGMVVEWTLILVFAWFVTRPWLNMDPSVIPSGNEFGPAIQIHSVWTLLPQCGACMEWYGGIGGGYPAFVDANGSHLHPLVILATLGWGVINGSKLALTGSFLMAGLAQWWLARELGLGLVARLWSAGLAIVGGHLAGRMQLGMVGHVMATAACSLALAALVAFSLNPTWRRTVVLGICLALAGVAGMGYLQLAFALSMPAALLLLPREGSRTWLLVRRFGVALALALLLAAPFLVPFLHILPEFAKDHDLALAAGQPLAFVPLNLVINDTKFYINDALYKLGYPSHYVNFIGWIPVLLAAWGWHKAAPGAHRRVANFLVLFAMLALWCANGGPQLLLARLIPFDAFDNFITGARYVSIMAGLAVPAILGLSALGVDSILHLAWPRFGMSVSTSPDPARNRGVQLGFQWIILVPLAFAIWQAYAFGTNWIASELLNADIKPVLDALKTNDTQWINPPEWNWYTTPALLRGLKVARKDYVTWWFKGREYPLPVLEARAEGVPQGMTVQGKLLNRYTLYQAPNREYAAVTGAGGARSVCTAQALGGNIDVRCEAPNDGLLTVKENNWSGWRARVDGQPVAVKDSQWLSVDLPAGPHTVEFRYRPWDVPLGLGLMLLGLALCLYLAWRRPPQPRDPVVAT